MKLLIVDDDEFFRVAMARLLRAHGLNVTQAIDGAHALTLLENAQSENAQFSFVVTDGQMPHMSGLELIMRMKRDPTLRDIPVVLITGAYESYLQSAMRAGARKVFRKLGDTDELVKYILTYHTE